MSKNILLITLVLAVTSAGFAQQSKHLNLAKGNLALDGYDPVAYVSERKAVKGNPSITVELEGARYKFSSEANKKLFISSPSSFKPEYGGWCAYAMGTEGTKVEVDPETFKVVDGKLYLFYNKFFNNTLDTWNKNENILRSNANKNWHRLTKP